jgi:hypothetical protein
MLPQLNPIELPSRMLNKGSGERPGALLARRTEEGMEPDDLSVLAQRAASEGPRWTRAVEDQSAPIPEEVTSKLGRRDGQPGSPPARGTRTIRMCSFDARTRGSTRLPLKRKYGIGRTRAVGDHLARPQGRR